MPDISTRDQSHGAVIAELKRTVEQQGKLLASLLPQTEKMPSDIADFDAEAERAGRVEKLTALFKEREPILELIDDVIDVLGDFVRAETMIRRDIAAQGLLSGVDKDRRNSFLGDVVTNATILARLGEFGIGQDKRHDRNEAIPKLASLVETQNFLLKQVQGA